MSTPAIVSHRIAARKLVAAEELAQLREPIEWKGIALIAHAWAVILASIALVAAVPNPLTYLLAVMLIGSRQLGLAILMHEGAHRCLSRNESRNMALSQWLCAYPVFADTVAYRRYHLSDHEGELPAQILARHQRPDRLRAAQGADRERAWRSVLAAGAAPAPLRRKA